MPRRPLTPEEYQQCLSFNRDPARRANQAAKLKAWHKHRKALRNAAMTQPPPSTETTGKDQKN